jgi:hypothetical protein
VEKLFADCRQADPPGSVIDIAAVASQAPSSVNTRSTLGQHAINRFSTPLLARSAGRNP